MPGKFVSQLNSTDVLFGRGSGPNDHEGNVRFRQYVSERKTAYMATNHRMTKTKIAREIVDMILRENGRFVKKVEAKEIEELGLPEGTECFEIVDDDTIMEKAKQALRQNAAKVRDETQKQTPKQQARQSHHQSIVSQVKSTEVFDLEPLPLAHGIGPATSVRHSRVVPHSVGSSGWNANDTVPAMASSSSTHQRQSHALPPHSHQLPPQHQHHQHQQQQHFASYGDQQQQHPTQQRQNQIESRNTHQQNVQHNRQPQPDYRNSAPQHQHHVHSQQQQSHHHHQQQQQQQPVNRHSTVSGFSEHSNFSMAEIPPTEVLQDSRRVSMTMKDLVHAHNSSREMSRTLMGEPSMDDLMDSFSQMKTTPGGSSTQDEIQRRMMASTETMGTIEPMGSVADMSLGTMNSSTFSLFRGNDSIAAMEQGSGATMGHSSIALDGVNAMSPPVGTSQNSSSSTNMGNSRSSKNSYESVASLSTSISISDALFADPRRKSNKNMSASDSMHGIISEVRRQVDSEYASSSALPRTVGIMEEAPDDLSVNAMGASSLSVLKTAFTVAEDDDGESSQLQQEERNQYYQPDTSSGR